MGGKFKVRVLIVGHGEESSSDAKAYGAWLKEAGRHEYEVEAEADFTSALDDMVGNRHDVYLVESSLTGYAGLDLIREAIAGGCDGAAILLVSEADIDVGVEARDVGAADCVVKSELFRHWLVRSVDVAFERSLDRRRMQMLANALESANESIVVTDPSGTIRYVNPAFTRLTGFTEEEAIGRTPKLWKSDRHPPAFYESMWKTILSGNTWTGEVTNRRKNGGTYVADLKIGPLRDRLGRITGFVGVHSDLTRFSRRRDG